MSVKVFDKIAFERKLRELRSNDGNKIGALNLFAVENVESAATVVRCVADYIEVTYYFH